MWTHCGGMGIYLVNPCPDCNGDGLVMKMEWEFITEFMFIVLPFSVLGAILFTLYEREIKEQ